MFGSLDLLYDETVTIVIIIIIIIVITIAECGQERGILNKWHL